MSRIPGSKLVFGCGTRTSYAEGQSYEKRTRQKKPSSDGSTLVHVTEEDSLKVRVALVPGHDISSTLVVKKSIAKGQAQLWESVVLFFLGGGRMCI